MLSAIKNAIGSHLASYLTKTLPGYTRLDTVSIQQIRSALRPADILLVDGNTRISTAIKYLTQSSWSHACLYVGDADCATDAPCLLEADLKNGVSLVPLSKYADFNIRICRPAGLTAEDTQKVISFAKARLGYKYDLKNITDLMRFLIQKPPVPTNMRRSMISLGSGDPTRAICSTLIAQAFQSIDYPILPKKGDPLLDKELDDGQVPFYYRRHFSHFTPRDFDLSPYFSVIKPTLSEGFDFHKLQWGEHEQVEKSATSY